MAWCITPKMSVPEIYQRKLESLDRLKVARQEMETTDSREYRASMRLWVYAHEARIASLDGLLRLRGVAPGEE